MLICVNPIYLKKVNRFVPCGKCGNCIKKVINDYVIRCKNEMKYSNRCWFYTLTYERDPLQLYKKDLQDFFKRCRKAGFQFSYFALGDYGDTFGRPHYHVIFFEKGKFIPEYIHSLWISGDQTRRRGFVHCRSLTGGRIAYVVRYGYLAKLDWDKNDKRQKPFFLLSRRPAIGSGYLTSKVLQRHRSGDIWYYQEQQYKRGLPRYYKDRIFNRFQKDLHNSIYWDESNQQRDRILKEISKTSSNPEFTFWERQQHAAKNFLDGLRNQKKLKNKLL